MARKIYSTYNYDSFKFIKLNRPIGKNPKLKKSLETMDLTSYNPIIVTPKMEIIDGQHRFVCCKAMKKPIYYVICDRDKEEAIKLLNTNVKAWRQEEYLNYYAERGAAAYVKMQGLIKEIPNLTISNAVLLFSKHRTEARAFKEGRLVDDSDLLVPVMDFINQLDIPQDVKVYRPFVNAVLNFFIKYQGSRDKRKYDKIARRVPSLIRYSRVEDYERTFDNWLRK